MLTVIHESLRRCGGNLELIRSWQRPADVKDDALDLPSILESGPTWRLTDQERDDLDVFAPPIGIFGLLNRTSTAFGARRLRDLLDNPCLSAERIRVRQEAVGFLQHDPARRLRLMGAAVRLRHEDKRLSGFVRAVHQASPLKLFAPATPLRVWSLIAAAVALYAFGHILFGHFQWSWLLAAAVGVNAAILRQIGPALTAALGPWRDVAWGAQGFRISARQGARDLPDETELGKLHACFAAIEDAGYLPSLCRRLGWAEHGGGFHAAMNYLLLYDLHVAAGILHRAVPNREALLAGAAALADLEALNSLACLAAEQPVVCFPTPTAGGQLDIRGGRHPLITPARVVANDLALNADCPMWLITGSNMAGKSTFLRMTGINVLLAQVGSAVPADEMRWSPVRLMTDLQARDNLAHDESYFLAEVRHLRRMVVPPAGEQGLLCLIDEPFRGTNSQDQSAASVALVRHLLRSKHLVLLATHDRNLTPLADGRAARNYHFREDLTRDGLVFDYRVYPGPAQTRNALRVLEREGYPAPVLADAAAWLEQTGEASQ